MREYTLSEIKESRLIMDKKPPAFGVIITLITLFFLVAILVMASIFTKTYIVKASGLVTSEDKTYIMNNVSGNITAIRVVEGQEVKAGDVLIELDDYNIRLQIEQMKNSNNYLVNKVSLVEKLILFVNNYTLKDDDTKINPFSSSDVSQAKQYGEAKQFIDYINQQIATSEENIGKPEYKEFTQSDVDGVKGQFLSQQYTTLEQYTMQKIDNESKIQMYTDSLSEYIVKAKMDGLVHFNAPLTIGTVLQAGSMIGSVSAKKKRNYI